VAFIGAYSIGGSLGDIVIMVAIGLIGYVLRKLKFPLVPLVIALVLGEMVEISLRRALILSDGSFLIFLKLLKLIAVPLIFVSLIKGISSLTDITRLSRIGYKTILIYIVTTILATTVGLTMVNILNRRSISLPAWTTR